jgi:ElaA protein
MTHDTSVTALQWLSKDFHELDKLQLYAALRLRQEVFVVEQQSIYLDLDNLDQLATHMLGWEDNRLVAYQRCLPPGASFAESALGRIVVAPYARGRRLGRELVRRGIRHNLQRWPGYDIRINAQSYLRVFYQELGFVADGEDYQLDGIPHILMVYAVSG